MLKCLKNHVKKWSSTWILRINNLNGFIYRPEKAVLSE